MIYASPTVLPYTLTSMVHRRRAVTEGTCQIRRGCREKVKGATYDIGESALSNLVRPGKRLERDGLHSRKLSLRIIFRLPEHQRFLSPGCIHVLEESESSAAASLPRSVALHTSHFWNRCIKENIALHCRPLRPCCPGKYNIIKSGDFNYLPEAKF